MFLPGDELYSFLVLGDRLGGVFPGVPGVVEDSLVGVEVMDGGLVDGGGDWSLPMLLGPIPEPAASVEESRLEVLANPESSELVWVAGVSLAALLPGSDPPAPSAIAEPAEREEELFMLLSCQASRSGA